MSNENRINLSSRTLERIQSLSNRYGYSPQELICLGLATVKMVLEAQEKGHVIVEAASDGKALTEMKFPEPQAAIDDMARKILAEPYSLSLERSISDLDPDNETPNRPRPLRSGDSPLITPPR